MIQMAAQVRAGDREATGCESPSLVQFTGWAEVAWARGQILKGFCRADGGTEEDLATGCIGRAEGRFSCPAPSGGSQVVTGGI